MKKNKKIFYQKFLVNRKDREKIHNNKSAILWFTGLSGAGKSTIANKLEKILNTNKISTYIIDGDNIRYGLCKDLNFSKKHRIENMRRVSEIAKIMFDAGILVLVTLISPYIKERNKVRKMFSKNKFFEIFIDTPLFICKKRDPKKLYQNIKNKKIKNFTGIDSIYEIPKYPEIYIDGNKPIIFSVVKILNLLNKKKIIDIKLNNTV